MIPDIVTVAEFVVIVIIAGICGGLARALFGLDNRNGLLSIVIGIAGGYLGMYVMHDLIGMPVMVPLPVGTRIIPVVEILIGATLLTMVASIIERLIPRKDERKMSGHHPRTRI